MSVTREIAIFGKTFSSKEVEVGTRDIFRRIGTDRRGKKHMLIDTVTIHEKGIEVLTEEKKKRIKMSAVTQPEEVTGRRLLGAMRVTYKIR